MRIEILERARKDFLDGFRFYEEQSEGVGHYFVDPHPAWIWKRLTHE